MTPPAQGGRSFKLRILYQFDASRGRLTVSSEFLLSRARIVSQCAMSHVAIPYHREIPTALSRMWCLSGWSAWVIAQSKVSRDSALSSGGGMS